MLDLLNCMASLASISTSQAAASAGPASRVVSSMAAAFFILIVICHFSVGKKRLRSREPLEGMGWAACEWTTDGRQRC